jgi:hypothetical protein
MERPVARDAWRVAWENPEGEEHHSFPCEKQQVFDT